MASFVTKLTGHKTTSVQSVRVYYKGVREEVEITDVVCLDHTQTPFDSRLKDTEPECWAHLMEQAIQDSIENASMYKAAT